jgi:hypothetical protein
MSFYRLRSNTRIIDLKRRLRCDGRRAAQSKPKEWHRASQGPTRIAPVWKSGHAVPWNKRGGIFRREVGGGEHAEIAFAERIYWCGSTSSDIAGWQSLLSRTWRTGYALHRKRDERRSACARRRSEPRGG